MGAALKDLGKLEEAIKAYNKALIINPEFAEAYSNKGNVLQDQGKLEEAVEAYKKVYRSNLIMLRLITTWALLLKSLES